MRLRAVERILGETLPHLHLETKDYQTPDKNAGLKISNLAHLRRVVASLGEIPALEGLAQAVLKNSYVAEHPSVVAGPRGEIQPIVDLVEKLRAGASYLQNLVGHALPEQDQSSISVELPPRGSLRETVAMLARLTDILEKSGGNDAVPVELQNFDSGSFYAEVKSALGIKFATRVAALTTAATVLANQYTAAREAQERLAALGALTADLKSTEQLNALVKARAREQLEKHVDGADPEELNRLVPVVQDLSHLIHEGVRLLPANNAPPEVMKPFENIPKQIAQAAASAMLPPQAGPDRHTQLTPKDKADPHGHE